MTAGNRAGAIGTVRAAAAALAVPLAALAPVPADADRHCAPALDLYYQARHAIRAAPDACPAGLERAAGLLAEAALAARNCDCPAMEARLRALAESMARGRDATDGDSPGAADARKSCEARPPEVFAAEDALGLEFDKCL